MWFIFVCKTIMLSGSVWVYVSMLTTLIIDNFGLNIYLVKLCIFILFSLVMLVIVEPEKIAFLSYYSFGVLLICVIIIISNGLILIEAKWDNLDFGKYNLSALSYVGIYLGINGFIYEGISDIPNMRRIMKDRTKLKVISKYTYICCGLIYFSIGFISYLAYGPNELKKHLFEYYYSSSNTIINKIQYIYAST